jgi:APA family basic amino acid/polyamine antiporter
MYRRRMKVIHFRRKLGLPSAVAVTVGAVIGVGIFVIVGPIGAQCGGAMPLAFLAAALPAVFGTLVSVALGGTIPADGGGYRYTKALLGSRMGAIGAGLVILGGLGAMCAVAVGVADYFAGYLPGVPRVAVAIALVLLGGAVNFAGLMASSVLQVVMVAQLASALIVVIVAGAAAGHAPDLAAPPPAGWGLEGFAGAAILASLAYTGFNIIGELGDEIDRPRRNVPLTIVVGLGIITLLYVGVAWMVAGSLTPAQLATSPVALADAAATVLPPWFRYYLDAAAIAGAVTSINAAYLAVPRELVALAQQGFLPPALLRYDERRQTFTAALAVVAVAGAALAATNASVDTFGVMAVVGLLLLTGILSVGALRLHSRFGDRIADAPFPIRRAWLVPCSLVSALLCLAFCLVGVLAAPVVGGVLVAVVAAALALHARRPWRRADDA